MFLMASWTISRAEASTFSNPTSVLWRMISICTAVASALSATSLIWFATADGAPAATPAASSSSRSLLTSFRLFWWTSSTPLMVASNLAAIMSIELFRARSLALSCSLRYWSFALSCSLRCSSFLFTTSLISVKSFKAAWIPNPVVLKNSLC